MTNPFAPLSDDDILEIGIVIENEGLLRGMSTLTDKLGYLLPLFTRGELIKKIQNYLKQNNLL